MTRTLIGKLYITIDPNLQKKNCRPDNAYRFIERINTLESTYPPSTTLMTYNTHGTHKSEFKSLHAKVDELADQMHQLA